MLYTPLEQFQIISLLNIKLFSLDFSFTNLFLINVLVLFLFFVLISLLISNVNYLGKSALFLIPNNWQILIENMYEVVAQLLFDNINIEGQKYFPFIFVLFCFILINI